MPTELIAPKLDLLFVVDNSFGMTDHQDVLARTVGDLLRALTNAATTVNDLHVGVITSSLGGYGANVCQSSEESRDDHAHLLGTRPRAQSLGVSTGYVTWTGGDTDSLVTGATELVRVAGEAGCGFEAPLESLYRFLADPNPPQSITLAPCPNNPSSQCASRTGTDSELLAQRAAFLRPDSAVAIVLLSNEDDCSFRESGQAWLGAEPSVILPKASPACATNPNDRCCYSCAAPVPSGCATDPSCQPPSLSLIDDHTNVRCFDQKRRFGVEFLYPVKRYLNALSQPTICPANADLDPAVCAAGAVANPLFAGTRAPSAVRLVSIVGVPWQTLAKQSGAGTLVYKTGSELAAADWAVIHGDPTASPPVPPTDPLMIASITPRSGTTPGTGEPLAPPTSGYFANSVNGHEWTIAQKDDLQYTCIFPLLNPRDCAATGGAAPCECSTGDNHQKPLCQASDGSYGPIQRFAKAYAGLRHMELVRGLGAAATVTSICPKNLRDPTQADYAYRPASNVLLRQLAK
jgi:hypothetical protein